MNGYSEKNIHTSYIQKKLGEDEDFEDADMIRGMGDRSFGRYLKDLLKPYSQITGPNKVSVNNKKFAGYVVSEIREVVDRYGHAPAETELTELSNEINGLGPKKRNPERHSKRNLAENGTPPETLGDRLLPGWCASIAAQVASGHINGNADAVASQLETLINSTTDPTLADKGREVLQSLRGEGGDHDN